MVIQCLLFRNSTISVPLFNKSFSYSSTVYFSCFDSSLNSFPSFSSPNSLFALHLWCLFAFLPLGQIIGELPFNPLFLNLICIDSSRKSGFFIQSESAIAFFLEILCQKHKRIPPISTLKKDKNKRRQSQSTKYQINVSNIYQF